jgi:uncharacterized protein
MASTMAKRIIKKLLPDKNKLKRHKHLQIFNTFFSSPYLWHINRKSVTRAVAIGLFIAFMPIPFQMVVSCGFAICFNANVLIAVLLVWITNPVTIPPILYMSYKLGAVIVSHTPQNLYEADGWAQMMSQFGDIWLPMVVGLFSFAIFFSVIGYFLVDLLWKLHVKYHWKKRSTAQKCSTKNHS